MLTQVVQMNFPEQGIRIGLYHHLNNTKNYNHSDN